MNEPLRVQNALVAVRYRVYPETPLGEVLDLMARRGVHAVPVVGSSYEVLGIFTTGDALRTLLKHGADAGRTTGIEGPIQAREVMTRTVLCVSEDQLLSEAAQMMVNRDVEQLPVVRDGALVGFITRDTVLRALRGGSAPPNDIEPNQEEA